LALKLAMTSKTPSTLVTLTFVIVVTGGVKSRMTVHVWRAGVGSARRATSTARTRRMCGPSVRPEKTPSPQSVNEAPSSAHSNVASGSSLSKAKVAIDSPVSGSVA
jgi:hypothetical protein